MPPHDDVYVAIPWRDTGDRDRRRSLMFVTSWLMGITGQPVHHADGQGERFSLAAARNAAVREARESGKHVVVICDADTIVDEDALQSAIELARTNNSVVLPFTLYRALGPEHSLQVINGRSPDLMPDIGWLDWSVGGVQVTTPETWDMLGGQDERFTGWGCEDTAFNLVADRMGHSHVRVEGTIHHLWHPQPEGKDTESESYKANAALLQRYVEAEDITEIVREHSNVAGD
jgi:hypothetical protein